MGIWLDFSILFMWNFLLLVLIVVVVSRLSKQSPSQATTHEVNPHSMIQDIKSEADYEKAIAASNLVIIDFYATWCGPCKMIAPMLEKFSQEYTGVSFYKIDVDAVTAVASSNQITSMPTFLFFKSGELVTKVIGANPAAIKKALVEYS